MPLLLLALASLLFALGGLFMKYSEGLTKLVPSLALFLFFCAGASLQARAMKLTEMGVAYISVLGAEAVFASALSVAVLHERFSPLRALAVVLVVAGITLLQRS